MPYTFENPSVRSRLNSLDRGITRCRQMASACSASMAIYTQITDFDDRLALARLTAQTSGLPDLTVLVALSDDVEALTSTLGGMGPATDLSNYPTRPEVTAEIAAAIDGLEAPDLSEYATTSDLANVAAAVPVVDLSDYATTSDVANMVAAHVPDLSGYATTSDLANVAAAVPTVDLSPYLRIADLPAPPDLSPYAKTSDIPDLTPYATKAEVTQQIVNITTGGTVDLSGYIKLEDLVPYAKTADLPDLAPYAKTADVANMVAAHVPDLSGYATTSDLANVAAAVPTVDLSNYNTKAEASATYATKAEVTALSDRVTAMNTLLLSLIDQVADHESHITDLIDMYTSVTAPDLSGYATTTDVANAVAAVPVVDLSPYAKTADLTPFVTRDEFSTSLAGRASRAELALKADKTELADYAKLTDIPGAVDLSGYSTTVQMNAAIAAHVPDLTAYAKKTDIPAAPDLTPYATKAAVAALPQMSDLNLKADKTDLATVSAAASAAATAATTAQTTANAKYTKPATGIPETDLADEVFSTTPYATNATASTGKKIYKVMWKGTSAASNDSDGQYFKIPNFGSLVRAYGVALNKVSYTRMPIPCRHGDAWCSIRVASDGGVWVRCVSSSGGDFNAVDLFIFIEFMQGTPAVASVQSEAGTAVTYATAADVSAVATALSAKADLVSGVVPDTQIPDHAKTANWTVASEVALATLTGATVNDRAYVGTAEPYDVYYLQSLPPTTLANWKKTVSASSGGGASVTLSTISLEDGVSPLTDGNLYVSLSEV